MPGPKTPAEKPPVEGTQPPPDGVRDTIESVVVALILAFVFRAFIVEAFVIPTGSMAPSLYGQHGQHRCEACGYSFAYGIREPMRDSNGNQVHGTLIANGRLQRVNLRCPNCDWEGTGNRDLNSRPENRIVPDSGDRILVLKWPYDIGGDWLGPKRWDVVVFKNPQDGEMNFIKRLIGLSGEVLEIINGDIYTAPIDTVREDIIEALRKPPRPHRPNERRLNDEQAEALAKVLKIRRKTPVAQNSLWMLHYDHDFIPRRAGRIGFDPPVWREVGVTEHPAWDAEKPVVRFKPVDDLAHWLRLEGRRIQDSYGYNNVNVPYGVKDRAINVGDVLLKMVLFPGAGEGEIILRLQKGPDPFQVRLSSDGAVRLEHLTPPGRHGLWNEIKKARIEPLESGEPLQIEFENLDYRVALRVNGSEVVWTDDTDYQPNLKKLLQPTYKDGRNNNAVIEIGAIDIPLEIRHLQVYRDVFYRSPTLDDRSRSGAFNQYPGWGTATNPILLRRDSPDYFCCGDNSPQSKDSRLWVDVCRMLHDRQPPNEYQYGTVPGDQLIGRAFFVYWPSGLRFSRDTWPLIPNVGRMRIIR
ncbi:MAG: S26 family signal peptidase [Phycisphaerae bacterium]